MFMWPFWAPIHGKLRLLFVNNGTAAASLSTVAAVPQMPRVYVAVSKNLGTFLWASL